MPSERSSRRFIVTNRHANTLLTTLPGRRTFCASGSSHTGLLEPCCLPLPQAPQSSPSSLCHKRCRLASLRLSCCVASRPGHDASQGIPAKVSRRSQCGHGKAAALIASLLLASAPEIISRSTGLLPNRMRHNVPGYMDRYNAAWGFRQAQRHR